MESTAISGVAKDDNVACISLMHLADKPGVAYRIFSMLAQKKINVDIILQSIGREKTKDIAFTVSQDAAAEAMRILNESREELDFSAMECDDKVSKLSIVGSGMINNPGIASSMFEALYSVGVNIRMISTSEIKVSVLIDAADAEIAMKAVHDKFFRSKRA